jgi:hypothetical protein
LRNVAARNIKVSRENAMMKPIGTAATLFAAALACLISGAALAQSSTAEPHANAPNTARPEAGGQGGGAEDRPDVVSPVLRIISVEVLRSSHGTPLDIIRVRGLASTPGWEEAELIPLTRGTPKDGILELVFVARAPAEAMEATGFEPIEAIFPIEASHPYKGINVHSASESVSLSQLPGYAEGKGGGEDCSKCVGKVFVAKGAAMPAGKSAAEVVKEEQLPSVSRVIRHSDGIPNAESNPNRLTIVVSKDGTIATAIWD